MKQSKETRVPADPVIANIVPTKTSSDKMPEGGIPLAEEAGAEVASGEAPFSPLVKADPTT